MRLRTQGSASRIGFKVSMGSNLSLSLRRKEAKIQGKSILIIAIPDSIQSKYYKSSHAIHHRVANSEHKSSTIRSGLK